jgi:hypothetical protein
VVHPEATRQAGAEDGLSERLDPGNGSLILGAEKRDPTAAAACMHARLESGRVCSVSQNFRLLNLIQFEYMWVLNLIRGVVQVTPYQGRGAC